MDLTPFCELVKQRSGLRFREGEVGRLEAAIDKRIRILRAASPEFYLARLLADAQEFQNLVNLLTVNETYFFREAAQLWLLADHLFLPMLRDRPLGEPVRILSVGCSTGEEPYSILMAHCHRYGLGCLPLLSVVATDIDLEVLSRAREGIYTPYSFRNLPPGFREQYFQPLGGSRYRLEPALQEQVRFAHFNVLDEECPPELGNLDVIFFRNVSIYFDTVTRRKIVNHLRRMLREGGRLFVGMTETLANDFGLLNLVEEAGVYHFVAGEGSAGVAPRRVPARGEGAPQLRTVAPRAVPAPPAPSAVAPPPPHPEVAPLPEGDGFQQALALTQDKRYDQALALIESLLATTTQEARLRQLAAHIHMNRRRFDLAEKAVRQALEIDPWSLDNALLLGQVHYWRREMDPAATWFRQAIYIRPDCWLAHYYLAELHRLAGQIQPAVREYRIVLQQATNSTYHAFSLFPLAVPVEEVRLLCQRHLSALESSGRDPWRLV